jgi:hypothetical protein
MPERARRFYSGHREFYMTIKSIRGLVLAFLSFVAMANAHADFIGQTFSAEYRYPDQDTKYTQSENTPDFVVDSGNPDASINIERVTDFFIDFTANTLRIDFDTILENPTFSPLGATSNTGSIITFNGLVFTAKSGLPLGIISASVDASSNIQPDLIAFTDSEIIVPLAGQQYNTNSFILINFDFVPGTVAVPEPGTLALLALALALLSMSMLRRQRGRKRSAGMVPDF